VLPLQSQAEHAAGKHSAAVSFENPQAPAPSPYPRMETGIRALKRKPDAGAPEPSMYIGRIDFYVKHYESRNALLFALLRSRLAFLLCRISIFITGGGWHSGPFD
jgi:hypothetical protein